MADMAVQVVDSMECTIELKADNTAKMSMKMMGQEQSETGTWKMDGNKLSMTIEKDGKAETKTTELKDGKFTITEENGDQKMEMIFVRK